MAHASGDEFVKKSQERALAKRGDIFIMPTLGSGTAPAGSLYTQNESFEPPLMEDGKDAPAATTIDRFVAPTLPRMSHSMTGKEKAKFLAMRTLGNFLILVSLYGVAATFGPALYYEVQFQVIKMRGLEFKAEAPKAEFESITRQQGQAPGFGDIIAGAKEQVLVPPDTQFSLIIPKIGATAKIWPNVDPLSEKDFLPKLQSGIAHAKGSVFPGLQGNVYLFAHSTDNFWDIGRYNAVFYLLKDLQPGDDISLYFENRRYNYKVDHTVIKDPTDVELLTRSQVPGQEQLILQTCWPPGTTWKRLFVIAKPHNIESQ